MVKLPDEQVIADVDRILKIFYDNLHRMYGRFYNLSILRDLEEVAEAIAYYSSIGFFPAPPFSQQTAMNRIREMVNLEFKIVCSNCGSTHYQDEITAPER